MTNIIDSLHEDHANLAKLLDALERQPALFDDGETPDYDIVQGVVDYCLNYPDRYHHPKEDLVLERLQALDPVVAAGIGEFAAEHQDLANLTQREDPLFGAGGEARFATLRRDILHSAQDAP